MRARVTVTRQAQFGRFVKKFTLRLFSKFGKSFTANAEPSLEIGRCRD